MSASDPSIAARPRRERGFTIVEIMVVVLIIGLLATIVGQNVLGQSDKAKVDTTKSNLSSLSGLVDTFYLKKNRLPETIDELFERDENGWRAGKTGEVPSDAWGNEFSIEPGEYRTEFIIMSNGPNGEFEDGEGDDLTTENMKGYDLDKLGKQ